MSPPPPGQSPPSDPPHRDARDLQSQVSATETYGPGDAVFTPEDPSDGVALGPPATPSGAGSSRRLARNLVYSWAGVGVSMVAGFVLPRSTDAHLGQTALGVWDFAWSIVNNFGLAQLGINTAVARYVGTYRGRGDVVGLRRMASSVLLVQIGVAVFLMGVTVLATWHLPSLIRSDLGPLVGQARWVLFFLGATLATQIACNTFANVIIGCHRWDLHNLIEGSYYAAVIAGMLLAQALGYGLRTMAVTYFCGVVIAEIWRTVAAYRVCPELEVRPGHARWSETREMLSFGGKQFIGALAGRLTYQVNAVQVARALGPAQLALYNRPMSLTNIVGTFVGKLATMLTPLASEMESSGRTDDIRNLLMRTTQASAFLALPGVVFLAIMSGPILRLWMGPRYESAAPVLVLLALGHLGAFVNRPMITILIGMNAQTRYILGSLAAAVSSVVLCGLFIGPLGAGLMGAALAVVLPLTLLGTFYLPVYGCRLLGVSVTHYFVQSWRKPLLTILPFAFLLTVVRIVLPPSAALPTGVLVGGGLLAVQYWRWVLPENLRQGVRSRARSAWRRIR